MAADLSPLPAPPRLVEALALHSRKVLLVSSVLFTIASLGSLLALWPIRVKENFQAYLECDGPYSGRLAARRRVIEEQERSKHSRSPRRLAELDDLIEEEPQLAARRLHGMQERTFAAFYIKVIYTTRTGENIFVPEHLQQIRHIEHSLVHNSPGYKDFCTIVAGECESPFSVINWFYATQEEDGSIIPDGQGRELLPIPQILSIIEQRDAFFVDRYFGVSAAKVQSMLQGNITRSLFRFGLPLRGFSSPKDREEEQKQIFRRFVRDELYPFLSSASTDQIRVFYYGQVLSEFEVETTVWHDSLYALGSLGFIMSYLVVYLRSMRLALAALACIALSFPFSYAMYCAVYGHGKMIAINFLSLFIILGVGADDVFVLSDVWKHSREHGAGEAALARRLWSMYQKAGLAIFATSATTAVSFFANLASSIGPLRQFGFFMGTCITMNWVVVASFYPLVLVVLERRYQRSPGSRDDAAVEMEERLVTPGSLIGQDGVLEAGAASAPAAAPDADAAAGGPASDQPLVPASSKRAGLLGRAPGACCFSLVGLAGAALPALAFVVALRHLRPSNSVPQFFPEDSNLGGLQQLQSRFGNETGPKIFRHERVRNCNGQLTSALSCPETPAPPWPSHPPSTTIQIVIPMPPSWQPPPKKGVPWPNEHHHNWQGSMSTSTTMPRPTHHTPAPWAPPAQAQGSDMDLTVKVTGFSPTQLVLMEPSIKPILVENLQLEMNDVDIEIIEPQEKTTWGWLSDSMAALPKSRRRLEEANSAKVHLRFHHLTPQKQAQVKRYLHDHPDVWEAYGVRIEEVPRQGSPPTSTTHMEVPPKRSPPTSSSTHKEVPLKRSPPTSSSTHKEVSPQRSPPISSSTHKEVPPKRSPPTSSSTHKVTVATRQPITTTSHRPPPPPPSSTPRPAHAPWRPGRTTTTLRKIVIAHNKPPEMPLNPTQSGAWTTPAPSPSTYPRRPTPMPLRPASSTAAAPLRKNVSLTPPLLGEQPLATVPRRQKPRGIAYDRTETVHVLWGFREARGYSYELAPDFDVAAPASQLALVHFCHAAQADSSLLVRPVGAACWPEAFKGFLLGRGRRFPSPNFEHDLQEFLRLGDPHHKFQQNIGFVAGGRPAWVSADFRVNFDTHSSSRDAQTYMARWEEFASQQWDGLSWEARSLGAGLPCADTFMRAEAELRVINSALSSWLVSVACALIFVVGFTRSLVLSLTATFAIFATAACSVFIITTVFQWHFGLMEAVSLIIFCGFSVDYPLHMVQAYVLERSRGSGVAHALREVGGAVASGCATTCGAAAFLLLCQIRIFTRFGLVLIVNMIFSLLFALVWIPAVLELREICASRRAKVAVAQQAGSNAAGSHVALGNPPEEGLEEHQGFVPLSGGELPEGR